MNMLCAPLAMLFLIASGVIMCFDVRSSLRRACSSIIRCTEVHAFTVLHQLARICSFDSMCLKSLCVQHICTYNLLYCGLELLCVLVSVLQGTARQNSAFPPHSAASCQ